ncbi:MAG: putative methylase [Halobacteriales archaeon]|jgi:putative methylase
MAADHETDGHLTVEFVLSSMESKRDLARKLGPVAEFEEPDPALEQYATPTAVAAHLVHFADLQGDVGGRTVVDLGTGTGTLALAAALRGASPIIGVDVDSAALTRARANERRIDPPNSVAWIRGDAIRAPLRVTDVTVVMNPPFGAQNGQEHADRRFLETTAEIAAVSYSIHNAGSEAFVESFAADHGGTVTHAFEVSFDLPHRFAFHRDASRELAAEAYRIEWN